MKGDMAKKPKYNFCIKWQSWQRQCRRQFQRSLKFKFSFSDVGSTAANKNEKEVLRVCDGVLITPNGVNIAHNIYNFYFDDGEVYSM